jgi:hypothetical protein
MREFFKPWRRKIGVVTLLVACLFMGIWVRSLCIIDIFVFHSGKHTVELLIASGGGLVWDRLRRGESDEGVNVSGLLFHKTSAAGHDPLESTVKTSINRNVVKTETKKPDIKWQMSWCGIGFGEKDLPSVFTSITFVEIPCWSIVVPLILLSAYLLLSKATRRVY